MKQAIGIDLGGTQIKCGLFDATNGSLIDQANHETNDGVSVKGRPSWLATIEEQALSWSPDRSASFGVAAPGLTAKDGRSIAFMPGRLEGLEGLVWQDALAWESAVSVLNDAQAALSGERWTGAARGVDNVILLTLGTGVGGAACVDGKLLRGAIGRAGHFGHISLNPEGSLGIANTPGSLEDAVGGATLGRRGGSRFQRVEDLLAASEDGDEDAIGVWDRMIRDLAAGICSLVNVLDPEVVLLGGGMTGAGERLLRPLQRRLDEIEWRPGGSRVTLKIGKLAGWAGAYGAAYGSLSMNFENDKKESV